MLHFLFQVAHHLIVVAIFMVAEGQLFAVHQEDRHPAIGAVFALDDVFMPAGNLGDGVCFG